MTETDNFVYNPVFYELCNGDYFTHNLGLYRKKEDAIRSIYGHIIETAINTYGSFGYLSDDAIMALEDSETEDNESNDMSGVKVCPTTEDGLDKWCIKYTNKRHTWEGRYDESQRICSNEGCTKGSWGWEINKMQIQ